mmetsp:Transcript_44091/g.86470  ORF Transcript_44091/g.86470 Transcript_44091/m.86470 type:complete len:250 (+) Transcript_44091:707-1456(+)
MTPGTLRPRAISSAVTSAAFLVVFRPRTLPGRPDASLTAATRSRAETDATDAADVATSAAAAAASAGLRGSLPPAFDTPALAPTPPRAGGAVTLGGRARSGTTAGVFRGFPDAGGGPDSGRTSFLFAATGAEEAAAGRAGTLLATSHAPAKFCRGGDFAAGSLPFDGGTGGRKAAGGIPGNRAIPASPLESLSFTAAVPARGGCDIALGAMRVDSNGFGTGGGGTFNGIPGGAGRATLQTETFAVDAAL